MTKLIEVVSQGIGAISKPYLIKKTADAKAYEIKKIAEAVKDHQETLSTIDYKDTQVSLTSLNKTELIDDNYPIAERTQKRLEFQESRRQQNIESITEKAYRNLENETEVSDNDVDNDWTTRFFNYAQDISNDEMQELWSRILSGEVKRPNSFSLRTLEVIKNLSKREAEIFSAVANYAISSNGESFLFNEDGILDKFGITFNNISLLQEIGLIQSIQFVSQTIYKNSKPTKLGYEFGNLIVIMIRKENAPEQVFSILPFSKVGEELLKLVVKKPDFKYIQHFAKKLKHELVDIKYAQILKREINSIRHSQPLLDIGDIKE